MANIVFPGQFSPSFTLRSNLAAGPTALRVVLSVLCLEEPFAWHESFHAHAVWDIIMNHDIIFQSIAQWPENKPVQGVSIKGGQKDGESWVMWVCKDDKHGCRSSSLSWQSSLPQRQREAQLPDVEMYGTEKHGVWGAMAALDLRQTRCSRRGWLYLNGCPSVPAFPALARHFPRLSWLLQSPGPGMGELGVCSCKSDSKCWSYAYTI